MRSKNRLPAVFALFLAAIFAGVAMLVSCSVTFGPYGKTKIRPAHDEDVPKPPSAIPTDQSINGTTTTPYNPRETPEPEPTITPPRNKWVSPDLETLSYKDGSNNVFDLIGYINWFFRKTRQPGLSPDMGDHPEKWFRKKTGDNGSKWPPPDDYPMTYIAPSWNQANWPVFGQVGTEEFMGVTHFFQVIKCGPFLPSYPARDWLPIDFDTRSFLMQIGNTCAFVLNAPVYRIRQQSNRYYIRK
jgi:hypothetical protein